MSSVVTLISNNHLSETPFFFLPCFLSCTIRISLALQLTERKKIKFKIKRMDVAETTPPNSHLSNPNSRTKSASRLARINYSLIESQEQERPTIQNHLAMDHISPSPKKTTVASPSPLSLRSSTNSLPPQELLLLSPASPLRRSRNRLADRLEMAEEGVAAEQGGFRRRCKSRANQMALLGCGSPRNNRRSRRRMEMDVRGRS